MYKLLLNFDVFFNIPCFYFNDLDVVAQNVLQNCPCNANFPQKTEE